MKIIIITTITVETMGSEIITTVTTTIITITGSDMVLEIIVDIDPVIITTTGLVAITTTTIGLATITIAEEVVGWVLLLLYLQELRLWVERAI